MLPFNTLLLIILMNYLRFSRNFICQGLPLIILSPETYFWPLVVRRILTPNGKCIDTFPVILWWTGKVNFEAIPSTLLYGHGVQVHKCCDVALECCQVVMGFVNWYWKFVVMNWIIARGSIHCCLLVELGHV